MRALALAALVLVTGCSLSDEGSEPAAPQVASARLVPASCAPSASPGSVAFVANGAAWALDPRTGRLGCLFPVGRPGPFTWGPRGDRALLARLEVKGVGDAPTRPAGSLEPDSSSWGRPIGKSIVFVPRDHRSLLKAHPAGGRFVDVTPVRDVEYERVAYHPSGLALAFVLRRGGREELWISSNTGQKPRKLVHGRVHTNFEAIGFASDGWTLYFAAEHADGRVDVHAFSFEGVADVQTVWRAAPQEHVTEIYANTSEIRGVPETDLVLTAQRSCATRRAVVVNTEHPNGDDALPSRGPTRALGWIDNRHVLVAAGRCGERADLHSVALPSLRARLLVENVSAGATRRPERLPPPELPLRALDTKSGFA